MQVFSFYLLHNFTLRAIFNSSNGKRYRTTEERTMNFRKIFILLNEDPKNKEALCVEWEDKNAYSVYVLTKTEHDIKSVFRGTFASMSACDDELDHITEETENSFSYPFKSDMLPLYSEFLKSRELIAEQSGFKSIAVYTI